MHRADLLRLLTAFVAGLCVLAQGAQVGHGLLVQHVRCSEHGEWVHADRSHHDERLEGDSAHAERSSVDRGADSQAHGHEHCTQLAERRELGFPPGAAVDVPRGEAPEGRRTLVGGASRQALDVWAFAPKTSPPV